MTATSPAAELALVILNEGAYYPDLRAAARIGGATMVRWTAHIATIAARKYAREFGEPGKASFTAAEILAAVSEVAEYHARRLEEDRAYEAR